MRQVMRSCACRTGPLALSDGPHAFSFIWAVLHSYLYYLFQQEKEHEGRMVRRYLIKQIMHNKKKQKGIFRTAVVVLRSDFTHTKVRDVQSEVILRAGWLHLSETHCYLCAFQDVCYKNKVAVPTLNTLPSEAHLKAAGEKQLSPIERSR